MHIFLIFLQVITSIVIIVSVMMQPSKTDGLSGLMEEPPRLSLQKIKLKLPNQF